jgi:hypothetical protein
MSVPLDLCASGILIRSRPVPSVASREKPSKRNETWAEFQAEASFDAVFEAIEAAFEAVFEAIEAAEAAEAEAAEAEAVFKAIEAAEATEAEAIVEAIEAAEAEAIEAPVEPTLEAGCESALEARADRARHTPSHALGVNLAGSPQPYQEG